jgi:tetratricopeptide (TPR) repeat protein
MTEQVLAQSLISLNNEALVLFLEGKLTDAIEILSHAYNSLDLFVDELQSYLFTHAQLMPGSVVHLLANAPTSKVLHDALDPKSLPALTACPPSLRCNPNLPLKTPLSMTSFASSSGEGTTHSMYNRGLILSLDPALTVGDASSLVTSNRHQTSATLLYNMALCYHNMGSHLGVSSALIKALQLYEMALESIGRVTNLLHVPKLLMAILNNCANIYTYFRQTDETYRCFENLKIVLAASTVDMIMDEDYDFFFLNAFFQSQELLFAPAA